MQLEVLSSNMSQLKKVAPGEVKLKRVTALHDLQLQIGASVNDPLCEFMATSSDPSMIQVGRGWEVELAFSMGPAKLVGTAEDSQEAPKLRNALIEAQQADSQPALVRR
jgi:hypothetical protein